MCDSMTELSLSSVIQVISDDDTIKEKLSRELASDEVSEINKDTGPEIPDKKDCFSDTSAAVPKEVLNDLVSGLLSFHLESLQKMSSQFSELTQNQRIVIETLQQENARFTDSLKIYSLEDILSRAKLYSVKLQQIKKEMAAVHERSGKLKKRALRLQQQKQREALQKEQQREQELERDKQLAPKLATKS